ncbi:MAG TPA: hypothetical protein VIM86_12500 [Thermodesulfobacteriota bacterium]
MRRSHLGLAALASFLVLVLATACGGGGSNAAPAGPAGPPQITLVAGGDGYLVYPDDTGLSQIFAGFAIEVLDDGALFWSPDGRYVAFVAENPDTPGALDLFVLDTTVPGAEPRNVTGHVAADWIDGVAFIGNRHVAVVVLYNDYDRGLYALDVTDPDPKPIDLSTDLDGDVYQWAPSPDGRYLAFVSYDGTDDSIHLVEAGSLVRRQVFIVKDTEFVTPRWSADGRLLAAWAPYYTEAGYVIDVSDPSQPKSYGVAEVLGETDVFDMAWSGRGRSLALEGEDTLYLIDASDPGDLEEPTNYAEIALEGAEPYSLAWSHDGRYLALVIEDGSDDSVWVVDAADPGSAWTLVTDLSASSVKWQLSWSAAGPYLAIGTGSSVGLGGPIELRVANLADLDSAVVHDFAAILGTPAGLHSWSPDGRYLAFVARNPETGTGMLQVLEAGSEMLTTLADAPEILGSDPAPVWRPRTP